MPSSRKILARLAAVIVLVSGSLCMAQDDLIRLIPSGAPVLAGMRQTPTADDVLWLVTRANTDDLRRFLSLTENDSFRRVDSIVVAAFPSASGALNDHLLLADGRFDLKAIRSAGAQIHAADYRGKPILIVQPSSGGSPDEEWLAILHGRVALYGSPTAVRLALDRDLRRASADPAIARRIRTLAHDDDAWSSLLLNTEEVRSRLRLSRDRRPEFSCLGNVHELGLGLRRQSTVRLDLRATDGAGRSQDEALACLYSLLKVGGTTLERNAAWRSPSPMHVSVSRAEYDRWLNFFRRSGAAQTILASVDGLNPADFAAAVGEERDGVLNP